MRIIWFAMVCFPPKFRTQLRSVWVRSNFSVRAAVRIIPSHEKWPTEADPSFIAQRYTLALQKQFSRPMTGHTPRKLPSLDAISRIIAVRA